MALFGCLILLFRYSVRQIVLRFLEFRFQLARDLPFARGNYSGFGRLGSVVFLYRHGQTAH
jgi:hypothetical protein